MLILSEATMKRGRPLALGEELDLEVRDNIEKQQRKGAVITRLTVTAIGKAVLMKRGKRHLLYENGGHVTLSKERSRLILHRINFVKHRGSTKVHVPYNLFVELKKEFLDNTKTTVVMENIPKSLIINWDQTGISFVPGPAWTMARQGSRRVEIAGLGDK